MTKRGPKSSAELTAPAALAAITEQARPDADYSLPDEAAAVWKATVESLPGHWIEPGAQPVLSAFCRTTVALRRLGQLIHQAEVTKGPLDLADYTLLLREHARQAQTLKTLATSLRLTPQTRLRAETAGRRADNHRPGTRPWDMK